MEILFSENESLTRLFSILISALEIQIVEVFFIKFFDLKISKKNYILFFVFCFFLQSLNIIFAPIEIFQFLNILIMSACLFIFLKQDFYKELFVWIIPINIFQLIKLFFIFLISACFNISPLVLVKIPILRPIIILPTYYSIFLVLHLFKKFNFSNAFYDGFKYLNKLVINTFSIISLLAVLTNTYLVYYGFNNFSFNFLIIFLALNAFVLFMLIMLIMRTSDLKKAQDTIDYEKQSYESLSSSYDSIREFKHDFSNIMQSIGGYLLTDDLDGLKVYYSSIFKECSDLKKISVLNKEIVNSPPVLSLIANKYNKAKELGIDFNIEILLDLTTLNMDIYEFTRILGIFLDNSIEAASKSSDKIINILITKDCMHHFDSIIIENSCQNSDIDTNKIFEKEFSTKTKKSGLGLWKVSKILNKYDNVLLNTSINNNLFKHQLKIYY